VSSPCSKSSSPWFDVKTTTVLVSYRCSRSADHDPAELVVGVRGSRVVVRDREIPSAVEPEHLGPRGDRPRVVGIVARRFHARLGMPWRESIPIGARELWDLMEVEGVHEREPRLGGREPSHSTTSRTGPGRIGSIWSTSSKPRRKTGRLLAIVGP
jgi:hypothetical protein